MTTKYQADPNRKRAPELAAASLECWGFPVVAVRAATVGYRTTPALAPAWAATLNGYPTLLHGPEGTGKTVGATRLAFSWLSLGYAGAGMPLLYRAFALLDSIKNEFGIRRNPGQDGPSHMQRAESAGLLVLDEIEKVAGSAYDVAALQDLFEARHGAERPTILISNHGPEGLAKTFGWPMLDRCRNGSGGATVKLEGASRRAGR